MIDFNLEPYLDYENLGSHIYGTVSELYAAIDLMKRGFTVTRPLALSKPYDLVAEKSNIMYRIEVKTTKYRADGVNVVFAAVASAGFDMLAYVAPDGKVVYRTEEEAAKRFLP